MLLGRAVTDFDIATNAVPDEIERLFDKTIAVGKAFGVIVVIMDDKQYEIAAPMENTLMAEGLIPLPLEQCSMKVPRPSKDVLWIVEVQEVK